MYTLIAFATQWGSKHGGINSFNADFLTNFGAAYHHGTQIICVVTEHTPEAAEEAAKSRVKLIALPYIPRDRSFDSSIGELSVDLLEKAGITFEPEKTIWLGHDLITGDAAIAAAKVAGGRSAVIHHMSYSDYESYAEDSEAALKKTEKQTTILQQADLVLAIGPLLRDAASDRLGSSKLVHMLVPGLPEIDSKEAPKTFITFLSGRLTADAARIKQGQLGVAAFAEAELKARMEGMPEALKRQPKLLLRGVDFENRITEDSLNAAPDPETELKQFAEEYAKAVVNLNALPYTDDRERLYSELSAASVALMPSWHEGFGLVAWEAIAAGVPLIIGENSGVYRLLEEEYSGAQIGYVYPLDVRGKSDFPYFRPEDLEITVGALKSVAIDPPKARKRASQLRNTLLGKFTWPNCCEDAVKAFGWDLQRGSVPDRTSEIVQEITEQASATTMSVPPEVEPLLIPRRQWRWGAGMADSQLLRAEEELLPFDIRRQPEVDKLTDWAMDHGRPITVRLITGEGGQGKTRLAIHVSQQFRKEGWHSGFLDSSLEPDRMPLLWRDLRQLNQPIVIVVDYAETRQVAFLALLKAALQNPIDKPVRILLLARNGGEWWDNLPVTNSFYEGLLNGPATTGPFELPPLYAQQQDRQQAFGDALRAFADTLQVDNPVIVPELVGDQFQRPLFVQMAALLALYGERPTTIQGLTKALLNHERRYWIGLLASFNWPDPGERAEQLLALATLAGGFATPKSAQVSWSAAGGPSLTTGEFNLMFRRLATLYPGTQGLQALRPDLLGEALVAQALLRPDADILLDAVLNSSATQDVRRNALTVLARMSSERADIQETVVTVLARRLENCAAELVSVSAETHGRLPELAELAFELLSLAMKNKVAGTLKQALPYQSLQLARLSCVVFGHLAERARQRLEQKPNNADRSYEYARALDRYGSSLFYAGKYEQSLQSSHATVLLMRKLVARDRNRYEAAHAACLFNYATDLATMGQDEAALTYDREALEVRDRLWKRDPNVYEAAYAQSLDHYGNRLAAVGEHQEALSKAKHGVEIYQKLATINPGRFEDDYAGILNNYCVRLSDMGHLQEALRCAHMGLEIRDRLREKNPDRFEPDYAQSLGNYAACLNDMGHPAEALACARDLQTILERLVQKQPQRFSPDLFKNFCRVRFLTWLCHEEITEDSSSMDTIRLAIPAHEQRITQIFGAFVEGCITKTGEARSRWFQFVLSNWNGLSLKQKYRTNADRLCVASWCSKFDSIQTDWHADWHKYWRNHAGNIPVWMREVAQRLEFQFPEVTEPPQPPLA